MTSWRRSGAEPWCGRTRSCLTRLFRRRWTDAFPFNTNYWDKGVFIDWDPRDSNAVNSIVDAAVKHWSEKPEFASKLSTFILFMEVSGAVGRADPASTSFAARKGRLWCTCITSWPDDDVSQRTASKKWCGDVRCDAEPLSCDHVSEQRHA